jgi:hypothetical protein
MLESINNITSDEKLRKNEYQMYIIKGIAKNYKKKHIKNKNYLTVH